jgi:hypothetical protein
MARRKKTDDEPKENQDNLNDNLNNESDDTFGLPEVEYEPLRRDTEETPVSEPETPETPPVEEPPVVERVEEPVYERPQEEIQNIYAQPRVEDENHDYGSYAYEPEKPSVWPKILAVGLILLLGFGAWYYFGIYKPKADKAAMEEENRQQLARQAAEKKRQDELAQLRRQEAEKRKADSLAAIPKEGAFEVLSERTGQYYIVVASAIDDDLLTDYAQKLVKDGKNVKIIPPFGKKGKFYRLAIDGKDNYADAQASADNMKGGEFGDQLWVVRY